MEHYAIVLSNEPVSQLTSAQQLHAVQDVVFDAGHEESTAQCCGQYGSEEAPPALGTVVAHHVVQQPEEDTKTAWLLTKY